MARVLDPNSPIDAPTIDGLVWFEMVTEGVVDHVLHGHPRGHTTYNRWYDLKALLPKSANERHEFVLGAFGDQRVLKGRGQLCVRLDVNDHPDAVVLLPEEYQDYLLIGDRVRVRFKKYQDRHPENANIIGTAGPIHECLFELSGQEVLALKGNKRVPIPGMGIQTIDERFPSFDGKHPGTWLHTPTSMVRRPTGTPFTGPISAVLTATHAGFSEGGGGVLVAPPNAGKTTLIMQLAQGVDPSYDVIFILAERIGEPRELDLRVTRPKTVYSIQNSSDPSRILWLQALAFNDAMTRAAMGRKVMVFWDGITQGLVRTISKLGELPNTAARTGGGSAYTENLITLLYGLAKCIKGGGSLAVLGTALKDPTALSQTTISLVESVGLSRITLSNLWAALGLYPALCFGVERIDTRQGSEYYEMTYDRQQDKWWHPTEPDFAKASKALVKWLSLPFIENEIRDHWGTGVGMIGRGRAPDRDAITLRANEEYVRRVRQIYEMAGIRPEPAEDTESEDTESEDAVEPQAGFPAEAILGMFGGLTPQQAGIPAGRILELRHKFVFHGFVTEVDDQLKAQQEQAMAFERAKTEQIEDVRAKRQGNGRNGGRPNRR